jgi:hypothetical protein
MTYIRYIPIQPKKTRKFLSHTHSNKKNKMVKNADLASWLLAPKVALRETKLDVKLKKRCRKKIEKDLRMSDLHRQYQADTRCARFQKHLHCLACHQISKIAKTTTFKKCMCGENGEFVTVVKMQYISGDHYKETVPFVTKNEVIAKWTDDSIPKNTTEEIAFWWHVYWYFSTPKSSDWKKAYDKMNRENIN